MNDTVFIPEQIYVDSDSKDLPLTQKIIHKLPHVPIEAIPNAEVLTEKVSLAANPIGEGKKILYITQQRGDFVKPCPCTPGYVCCNYYILNLDLNCPLDCTYCILQLYLNHPWITVHANTDELWQQLDRFLLQHGRRTLRLGSGELGDSLVLDHLTERSKELISYFRNKNAVFELKTKTTNIQHLLDTDPAENIVIAWSLNANQIAESDESGAPSISARLDAAQAILKRGYRIAFHFDPIIRFPDWENGYEEVLDDILSKFPWDRIAWISLGTLRFPPALKDIIMQRFPQTKILFEEFIRGQDGKSRYFRPLREELYRPFLKAFQGKTKGKIPLYFCMESKKIWKDLLKKEPEGKEDVERLLSLPSG